MPQAASGDYFPGVKGRMMGQLGSLSLTSQRRANGRLQPPASPRSPRSSECESERNEDEEEPKGASLKQHLQNSDTLQQIMFSVVLLHWYVYNDGSRTPRHLDFNTWKALTLPDVEAGDPESILHAIYTKAVRSFIPELTVAMAGKPTRKMKIMEDGFSTDPRPTMYSSANVVGWARVASGGLSQSPSLHRGLSESASARPSIFTAGNQPIGSVNTCKLKRDNSIKDDGRVWLSVFHTVLFFSTSPTSGSPYAFLVLPHVHISDIKRDANSLTLSRKVPESMYRGSESSARKKLEVQIVHLLPDGRWQEFKRPELQLQFPSTEDLETWQAMINSYGSQEPDAARSLSDINVEITG